MKKILALILAVAMLLCVTACGSNRDFKADVQGDWVLYHYYENAEGGADVFFDETNYWKINVGEDSFTVTAEDGSLENVGGKFTWTKADEAEVVMNDGTRCTMHISENSKEHNELAEFDVYVLETKMFYVLEFKGGESK